ncbi:M20 family metallopeptidase [Fusibacter sp. 3D3]|uniref:M20 family metallopeptidase n=1 Tax=Fusibacter sp. 3D3 TaxID=1048380 RepID=UPI000852CE86|nr:M20/M25/M40 family metallo-hydrolase [Fusibacter sp. 3D3]GAU78233.1 acetylornithine deacetylase [Fusibacter sp. 3D3]
MHNTLNDTTVIDLLGQLIQIHSPYFHEHEIMNYVYQWLKGHNIDCELVPYEESLITGFKGLNIVGRIKGRGYGPNILLNGHLDTVNICEGWLTDPLTPVLKEGLLYGLGALDMKSGVVAQLLVLKELNQNKAFLKGDVIFSFVSDEEGPYGLGTNFFIDSEYGKDADVALVAEPSSGFTKKSFPCLCLGARGGYNYTVEFFGKSAHAANPEQGINAAIDAAKVMACLEDLPLIHDEQLGSGSLCIVDVKGGHDVCSVPDKASFTVFRHIVRGETKETIIREVEAAVAKARIKSKYNIVFRKAPSDAYDGFQPYVVDEKHPFTDLFCTIIENTTNSKPNIAYFSSIGDFNFIASRMKIPTYVFGPSGDNYHTHNENVQINTVTQTAHLMYQFIKEANR